MYFKDEYLRMQAWLGSIDRTKVNGVYSIVTVRVPKGEYAQFAIGDTIKQC